jgi:hypothetical protein
LKYGCFGALDWMSYRIRKQQIETYSVCMYVYLYDCIFVCLQYRPENMYRLHIINTSTKKRIRQMHLLAPQFLICLISQQPQLNHSNFPSGKTWMYVCRQDRDHTYIHTYIQNARQARHTYIITYIHTYIHTYRKWLERTGRPDINRA